MTDEPTKPKLPDAYFDLGITSTASAAEIKSAYRSLALVHHPDKKAPGETIDAAEFRRIHEAWELLKDDQAKARYDNAYIRVRSEWLVYRKEVVEFTQSPEAWRSKQVRAQAAATQWSQAQYQYDDSDEDDEDWEDYEPGGWFHFGGPRWGGRPSQEEREKERRKEEEARSRYHEAIRKTDTQRTQARENANKRAIERQRKGVEAQQEQNDGIRILGLEAKLAMAKEWVEGLQHKYAEELRTVGQCVQREESIDLGWEKRKGRQICHFCDALVHEYSFRCPSGGAIACRVCKKAIALASPSQPFTFVNDGSNAKKGRGRKCKGKKKGRKTRTKADEERNEEEPEPGEQDVEENEADEEETREQKAREQEAQAEKARAQEEREARRKATREAREKAIREKAATDKAARETVAADKAARETEAREKAAHEEEVRQKKAHEEKARNREEQRKEARARNMQESPDIAARVARGNSTTKNPTRKAPRLPPVCFNCNAEGHVARKCPTRSRNKKAPKNNATPLKPVVKLPAAAESTHGLAGATSGLPTQETARKPRPAKQTQQRSVNTRNNAHLIHTAETPLNSTSNGPAASFRAPVEGGATKDSTKRASRPTRPRSPPVCYTCN